MLEPFEWNVVVAGAWNRALLTPAWLQRRVFKDLTATLDLFLPVEYPDPPRVKLGDMTVEVSTHALVVGTTRCTYASLAKAKELAKNALDALGETPISGVGINVRYKLGDLLPTTLDRTKSEFDRYLVNSELTVREKAIHRALTWGVGILNLTLSEDHEAKGAVLFNFHLGSLDHGSLDVAEAKAWLQTPVDSIAATVEAVLYECIGIEKGGDDAN